jgi:hypothetical protein
MLNNRWVGFIALILSWILSFAAMRMDPDHAYATVSFLAACTLWWVAFESIYKEGMFSRIFMMLLLGFWIVDIGSSALFIRDDLRATPFVLCAGTAVLSLLIYVVRTLRTADKT